jgi:beta-lactamase class A
VGIAVSDVNAGWIAQVDGGSIYPQQSVSKIWTAMTVLDRVDRGELHLGDGFTMGPQDRSVFPLSTDPVIGPTGYPITLTELLQRAIENSDNAANDKLMGIAGGADAITAALDRKGLTGIRVGGPERELQAQIAGMVWQPAYGVGHTFKDVRATLPEKTRDEALARYLDSPPDGATPVGLVRGLSALQKGELLSSASRDVLIGLMHNARTGPMRLKGGLPQGWSIAHKTGTGQDWRGGSIGINDVGLITAPDGRVYAVAVMIRRTTKSVPERMALMQMVSREVVASWQTATGLHVAPAPAPAKVAAGPDS